MLKANHHAGRNLNDAQTLGTKCIALVEAQCINSLPRVMLEELYCCWFWPILWWAWSLPSLIHLLHTARLNKGSLTRLKVSLLVSQGSNSHFYSRNTSGRWLCWFAQPSKPRCREQLWAMLPSKEQWRLHSSEAGVGTWDSLHARGKLHVTPCPVQQGFLPGSSAEGWRNWRLELPADLKLFFFSCGSWKGY